MEPIEFALAAVVAIIVGTVGRITHSRGSWFVNVGLAFMGALAGTMAARHLDMPEVYDVIVRSTHFPVIYSTIGSVLFVAAIGFLLSPGRRL